LNPIRLELYNSFEVLKPKLRRPRPEVELNMDWIAPIY